MAMVVLEVGLLGVVGTLVLAARTMHRAETIERVVTEAGRVYDSVSSVGATGSGEAPAVLGRVRWSVGGDGGLDLDVVVLGQRGDSVMFSLRGRTLPPGVR
jgi:hypothetical protein